eukprot:178098-Lingulodinium_polyedra.AAC.1
MLRRSRRSGRRRPPTLAATARPDTRAQATLTAQSGAPHPCRTSCSQPCPMRSKAFSWPASVAAGQCLSSGVSAPRQRAASGSA